MDERLKQWHPDHEEVARIVAELRPIIRQLASRANEAIVAEEARRRTAHLPVCAAPIAS